MNFSGQIIVPRRKSSRSNARTEGRINEHQKENISRSNFKVIRARVVEKCPPPCTDVGTDIDAGIKLAGVAAAVGALGFAKELV